MPQIPSAGGVFPAGVQPRVDQSTDLASPLGPFRMATVSGVLPVVGRGTFGTVLHAFHPQTGAKVVLKFFTDQEEMEHELAVYHRLAITDPPCGHRLFVAVLHSQLLPMPWLALSLGSPNLHQHLRQRSEGMSLQALKALAAQVVLALSHLLRAGFLHLDLKPTNLLWNEEEQLLRLVDFSLSEPWPILAGHQLQRTYCTWPYRPPELAGASEDASGGVSPAVDVWSLGCVLYEAALRRPLVCHQGDLARWREAQRGEPRGATAGALRSSRGSSALPTMQARLMRLPAYWRPVVLASCVWNASKRPSVRDVSDGMVWVDSLLSPRRPGNESGNQVR